MGENVWIVEDVEQRGRPNVTWNVILDTDSRSLHLNEEDM